MDAIHIHTILSSDTPHLPELKPFLGKSVEIIVKEETTEAVSRVLNRSLAGSILRDDDPFGPAVAEDEWEANR